MNESPLYEVQAAIEGTAADWHTVGLCVSLPEALENLIWHREHVAADFEGQELRVVMLVRVV